MGLNTRGRVGGSEMAMTSYPTTINWDRTPVLLFPTRPPGQVELVELHQKELYLELLGPIGTWMDMVLTWGYHRIQYYQEIISYFY